MGRDAHQETVAKMYASLVEIDNSPADESTKLRRMENFLDEVDEDTICELREQASDGDKNTIEDACTNAVRKGWAASFTSTADCEWCKGEGICGGSQCDNCICGACGQEKVECGGC
jgi:hypothetical protein